MIEINKEELLGKYFEEALQATKEIVAIPSYRRDITINSPVHEDTKRAVDYAINKCKDFGLKTFIAPSYRYAYADWENGDKLFGIICHLDVVPPGNLEDWNFDPFNPVIEDGKLLGRGTFDDKGPSIMNLYAVKYLMDNGFKPDYTIRFIFCTSEETNWECMEEYVAKERICDLGYVPDAEFPVVYAEKWIVSAIANGKFQSDFTLKGGEVFNAVLDTITYCGPKIKQIAEFLNINNIKTKLDGDNLIIRGKAAHGSLPEKGVSAASWALKAIEHVGIKHPVVELFSNYIHNNHDMKEVFGDLEDETGKLTVCNGKVNIEKDKYEFFFNFRVPCLSDPQKDIIDVLEKFIEQWNMSLKIHEIADRVYFDQEGPVVKNIMKVYQEVTGDLESKPIAIGGGTFAKSMPNMIAFGAEFNVAESKMHADNEFVKIEDLKKMLEIYCKAITKLTIIQK